MTKTICLKVTHKIMAKAKPAFIYHFELESMENIFKNKLEKKC